MPKITINADDRQEIRAALVGLSGTRARQEAERWAQHLNVHPCRIYEITKDLRPARKPRTDKGKRRAELLEHPGMRTFAELVTTKKLDPDQAIEMARANGHDIPVSLGTARRYLRENGLNRRRLRSGIRPFRQFEAAAPGEIYQFDISGVKERWIDVKTRRILHVSSLDVSKNHPNQKITRIPLWKFVLVDDYSRVRYVRFIACAKPDSAHVIDFLLGAFRELGIPLVLYTDNDAIIVSRQMRRAASILDRAFAASGGFKLEQHLPGNPQATGKVEVAHQLVEKFERYIGALERPATLAELELFTRRLCEKANWTAHRTTGEIPALRFRHGNAVMRIPPDETLNSAFKSLEFEREIRPNLTFSYENVSYQLPRNATVNGERNPFVDWVGQKVRIIWPNDADYFVVIGLNRTAYELERRVATADRSGEFKTAAESTAQRTTKALKEMAAAGRAARKAAGTEIIVPGFQVDFEKPGIRPSSLSVMPRKKEALDPALLAALGNDVVPPSMVTGQLVNRWTAAEQLQADELLPTPLRAYDKEWLDSIFTGRDEMPDNELRELLAQRVDEPARVEIRSA